MWRDVFSYSVRPEIYLDADNIRGLFPELPTQTGNIHTALSSLNETVQGLSRRWQNVEENRRAAIQDVIITQSAPLAASMGVALQGLSAPGVFEDPLHLQLMSLLADDIGVGVAENSRFDRFCILARTQGVANIAVASKELCDVREIRDICFRAAAIIYALSRRSDVFADELIGLDFAWRSVGLLPVWRALERDPSALPHLDMGRGRGAGRAADENLHQYADALIQTLSVTHQARIVTGIALFDALLREHDEAIYLIAQSLCDPRLAMAVLIQERAREAQVYHDAVNLEGRPLSQWFAQARDNPLPLVDAIGRSRLVRPGLPERSPLIHALVSEKGSMFRIFSEKDIRTISDWIVSLTSPPADEVITLPPEVRVAATYQGARAGDSTFGPVPGDIRSAYFLLQGRALPPATRDFAREYCLFWLNKAQDSIRKSQRSFPQTWAPGVLREWLLASHDAHAQGFSASQSVEMPTREEVIAQTLQLAPLTLIDGAWLQGFTEMSLASSRVGSPLFETYWDELGNGQWTLNHPKIYRDVLAAMSITLPETGSLAFAQDIRFSEDAFRLPVYWLCLGKFPLTFRAEILGMNLAMELSGVGGSYRNAHQFLKHYGLPTTFVDLHNTIDNVSTGHAAWAAEAIDSWMQLTRDLLPVEESWARIRRGYESLSPRVDDPQQLNFFTSHGREATPLCQLPPLLHRQLQTLEVAE